MFSLNHFEGYNWAALRKDLLSGLIVGVIAIPLGMAFAIASGVKPEYGIYTTIVAGILISLFGGSKFQIGGPTGAFIPILFAIVMQYGYENLLLAGMIAGVMLLLMGALRLGALIKYVPRPVTIGFTAGIAVIIFCGQIANFLGLSHVEKHERFWPNMREILENIASINGYSLITAGLCLGVILVLAKIAPKIPATLVGLILSTLAASLLFPDKVATIGSTFGAIPSTLPHFQMPDVTWDRIQLLLAPAFTIAMLGGIESLLSAVVADNMTGSRHNSNRELIGQGIANVVTPLFGGIPATGAIARTAANIKTGAVSPLSGVIHGVVVLLVLLLFAPYASHIPLAGMAPILMIVAWNMSERISFARMLRIRTSDSIVLVITFLLTVFTDLTIAVGFGLFAAFLLYIKQMSEGLKVTKVLPDPSTIRRKVSESSISEGRDCPQIDIFTVEGSLFFGTAAVFEQKLLDAVPQYPRVLLLRMGKVPYIDTTGTSYIAKAIDRLATAGVLVLMSGVQAQPLSMMIKSGLYDRISSERMFKHTGEAIQYALQRLDFNKCIGCRHFAFYECAMLSDKGVLPEVSAASKAL